VIVGGRTDWDWGRRGINAGRFAGRRNLGKSGRESVAQGLARVQKDGPSSYNLTPNPPRYDIARREFSAYFIG
jgi:hypothetical protein